jgi:hypothetical protein
MIDHREMGMAWRNNALTLYHGTAGSCADDILANGINLAHAIRNRDFGPGFYTARSLTQAVQFANDTYRRMRALHVNNSRSNTDPLAAAVIEFTVDRNSLSRLSSLAFVLPTDEWREFVMHCRNGGHHKPDGTNYDLVYGPVSTMYYTAWPNYEQLSFHSVSAIGHLVLGRAPPLRGKPTL